MRSDAKALGASAARLDGKDPAEEKKRTRRRLVVDQVSDLIENLHRIACSVWARSRAEGGNRQVEAERECHSNVPKIKPLVMQRFIELRQFPRRQGQKNKAFNQ
jgi:hypothetical protein